MRLVREKRRAMVKSERGRVRLYIAAPRHVEGESPAVSNAHKAGGSAVPKRVRRHSV